MSLRAIILGLLLGLGLSAGTYFNDFVIRQTMLIGNHLPISVFGLALMLLLGANPLLRPLGQRWPLRPGEVALIVAVALAACGWPGSGYFRGFASITASPAHHSQVQPAWRSAQVMSYVPDASPRLAPGQVRRWPSLVERLLGNESLAEPMFSDEARRELREIVAARHVDANTQQGGVSLLNRTLIEPTGQDVARPLWQRWRDAGALPAGAREALQRRDRALDEVEGIVGDDAHAALRRSSLQDEAVHWERHANRAVLAAWLDGVVMPAPSGRAVLAAQGRLDERTVGGLMHGQDGFEPANVPWRAWWPVLVTWGGAAVLIGIASLALALIVHPQWSRRELLPYPIARFVEEMTRQDQRTGLPALATSKLFWGGFAVIFLLHVVNGLHNWFPDVPQIQTQYDFNPLRDLFPHASRAWGSWGYFAPRIYPAVIAFAFFLTTPVSFSLGISQVLFMIFAGALIARGVSMDQSVITAEKGNLLRFGAFAGVALMILYTGRHHYAQVALRTVGLGGREVTRPTAWAGRVLLLCLALCVVLLQQAGLSPMLGAAFVLLVMMMLLVLSRLVAETGVFFLQPYWMPVAVLVALFGVEAFGPTAFIVLALASVILVGDPREALMPYITNGLQMVERTGRATPARAAPWLLVMIVVGFVVAGFMTLSLQYQHGLTGVDTWTRETLPSMPFNQFAQYLSEMSAQGTLEASAWSSGMERLGLINPAAGAWGWAGLGVALVLVTALARLRLSWWPLHPVAFLVWGTYPIVMFGPSFLIGWLVKLAVVSIGGAAAYRLLVPMMIGVIAGELSGGLLWIVVGAIYYAATGRPPETYSVFPG